MFHKLVVALLLSIELCLGLVAGAQADPIHFTDRAAFTAASTNLTTIDFEAVAPGKGWNRYLVAEGLTTNGINFRTSGGASAGPGQGTIAYMRGGKEIRLIEPDGSGDRRIWTHPQATEALGITGLAWRPDGKELAFASSHAAVSSLYHSDIYAIRPDGKGLRKVTSPPDRSQFARFPKGSVRAVVRNDQPVYRQAQASAGIFMVYVAGAQKPQQITLPPGTSKTLLFQNVADFGKHAQPVVAMWGKYRWFIPGLDVRAGRTMQAPTLTILGNGIELFGAFRPVWRRDGTRISYRSGVCTVNSVPANPAAGEHVFKPLFSGKHPLGTCTWDWGPTPAVANQIIYTENTSGDSSIYRIPEGRAHPGVKLTTFSNIEYQMLLDLRWLPNGSGFLYANKTLFDDAANIFRYDFATKKVTNLTQFQDSFARAFSIAPDGQWVVFERGKASDEDAPADLWVMRLDGSDQRLLVRNGKRPSWGK